MNQNGSIKTGLLIAVCILIVLYFYGYIETTSKVEESRQEIEQEAQKKVDEAEESFLSSMEKWAEEKFMEYEKSLEEKLGL